MEQRGNVTLSKVKKEKRVFHFINTSNYGFCYFFVNMITNQMQSQIFQLWSAFGDFLGLPLRYLHGFADSFDLNMLQICLRYAETPPSFEAGSLFGLPLSP